MDSARDTRVRAAEELLQEPSPGFVAPLVDALFFTPPRAREQLLTVLEAISGETFRDYYDWVRFVGAHSELTPASGYPDWKRQLLQRIDPSYAKVFYPGAPVRIRLEEIIWGGVSLAGIPALDDPPRVAGSEARYLRRNEQVFGIVIGDEAHAYPLRILSWHELVNDHLGGEPITLSFCTLCGSGIFYSTRMPNGSELAFDTSGLLYRSNKLMVDRRTLTLWSNLTGAAVVGRLAHSERRLQMLPGTLTTWRAWLERHPDTTVLDLNEIERRRPGSVRYDYRPGVADRARRGVSFPVWLESGALEPDREVFTLRLADVAKAYPVDRLLRVAVLNDQLGGQPIVLIGERSSGAVRAYHRGSHTFSPTGDGELVDAAGRRWVAHETSLSPVEPGSGVEPLERLPGHVALWFGWYGFFPQTQLWTG